MPEIVYTRDVSSGRVHKRIREGDRLMSDERDNLDESGAFEVLTEAELAEVDPERFCRRCFPTEPVAAPV